MLNHIPHQRLVLYVLLIGLIPVILVGTVFFSRLSDMDQTRNALEHLQQAAFLQEKKQSVNISLRNHFSDADHFYIDKQLETLAFLEPEVDSLSKVSLNKNYAEDENLKKRLEFLSGSSNNMIFSEGTVQSYPLFQETTETLVHPVEVNTKNIQEILTRVEGVEIGPHTVPQNRPQLLILEFKLDRKHVAENSEVFLLNMKLLKREFL